MKLLTPTDLQTNKTQTGYRHVHLMRSHGQHGYANGPDKYVGVQMLGQDGTTSCRWKGPRRSTPLEAAQDYCDYVNGNNIMPAPALKTAGHATKRSQRSQHPKRIEGRRLIREARADEDAAHPEGYVYLVGEERPQQGLRFPITEAVKIGKSADHPQYRLNGLQTGNPRKLVLLGFLKVPDRHKAESELHARYAHLNVLQEWFRPSAALMSEFGLFVDGSRKSERKAA